jgi:hypothetical protein
MRVFLLLLVVMATVAAAPPPPTTHYFDNYRDHFNQQDATTYRQKYLVSSSKSWRGRPLLFFYTGNGGSSPRSPPSRVITPAREQPRFNALNGVSLSS